MRKDAWGDDDRARALTDEQVAAVERWVRMVAPRLGLCSWDIGISPFAADATNHASIRTNVKSDDAWIAVDKEFPALDREDQRTVLTHELLHCHVNAITDMVGELVKDELGQRAEALISAALGQVEEQTVDRLARAVAKFLPYVEWSVV